MLCPNCKTENLVTSETRSVQIDHCPRCRGVWLDRGELEKLIQVASTEDEGRSERYNEREYGEEAPRKRGYGESGQDDDDDDRGEERGESYRSRERDNDDRSDSSRNRDSDYDSRSGRGDQEGGRSIWREIFENLGDKLPRP